jgi:hypothetical protein
MKTTKKEALDPEPEETEEYLKYIIKDCTFNITVESGGTLILQTGKPTPPPTPPH